MNKVNYTIAKPIRQIDTTTLAQDAFNLYSNVLADVVERIKGDLKDMGKPECEVNSIAKSLRTRWKRALDEMHCIDHEHLIGIGLNDIALNIGQQQQIKRPKLSHINEAEHVFESWLPSGSDSLKSTDRISVKSEVNPYLVSEDVNDYISKTGNTNVSGSTSPSIKDDDHSIKSKPEDSKEVRVFSGVPLHDNVMTPEMLKKGIEKPLGSDDDDSDKDDEEPTDLVVCAYSKVLKKKGVWNMELKNGVIHFAGKDYAFKTATGGHLKW